MTIPTPQPSRRSRLRFLLTPRWITLQAVVVAFVLSCYFLLAPWQFARSQEHDRQMSDIAAAAAQAPVPVSDLLSTEKDPTESIRWRQVTATGHFDAEQQAYIRLRQDASGQPAYEVVAPFITDDGVVLVDRGYFPFQAIQEQTATPPPLPAGTVTIVGRIQPDQVDPKGRPPTETPDGTTAYIAVNSAIATGAGSPVYRGYLDLTAVSPGVITEIPLPQGDDSRPFFSYAIQWLSFGAIAVAGLAYFIYREYTDPVSDSIYIDDPDPAAPEPVAKPRRSPRGFDKSTLYDD